MRIWSLHPKYLDSKGLIALWRETLLAKNVLGNKTRGYRNHPQLIRFIKAENPIDAINYYLTVVYNEASSRNYNFDKNKIGEVSGECMIPVNTGQIKYEFEHLLRKLRTRDIQSFGKISEITEPEIHPLFILKEGDVEKWEKRTDNNY
jgi:hypothetical protein